MLSTTFLPIARLECERQNGDSHNGTSSKKRKTDLKNSLLSRCRTIESRAPDVMFDPSEVRQILELVLEQLRSTAEEEVNEDASYSEADNDEDSQDEEEPVAEVYALPAAQAEQTSRRNQIKRAWVASYSDSRGGKHSRCA